MADEVVVPQRTPSIIEVEPGIGQWTAEMFLIFSLNRLDVLPLKDLGIKNAIQEATICRIFTPNIPSSPSASLGTPTKVSPVGTVAEFPPSGLIDLSGRSFRLSF